MRLLLGILYGLTLALLAFVALAYVGGPPHAIGDAWQATPQP
jgi:hypothetical protein